MKDNGFPWPPPLGIFFLYVNTVDCTLCLGTEAAGVCLGIQYSVGAAAPVTGAAADSDEYNLNVVDCNASVTVPRLVLGLGGTPSRRRQT